jgi:hypothetical protein
VSELIGVTVEPTALELAPQGDATISVQIVNQSRVVDEFGIIVDGVDPSWVSLAAPTLSLFPGGTGKVDVAVRLPDERAISAGPHPLHVVVVSRHDPNVSTEVDLALEVLPVGRLELSLVPKLVKASREGRYRIHLANESNAEERVALAVTDPEEGLVATLGAERVVVAPWQSEDVPLTVRPRQAKLIAPPKLYPFTISAAPAGGEAAEVSATVDGQLLHQAPLAFLARLPPRVRAIAFGALGLLLALAIAIWLLTAPGSPFHRPPPSPTPTAPALPAAAAAAGAPTPTTSAAVAGATPTPGPTGPAPTIVKFDLSVPPNGARGDFQLAWEVQGASQVTVAGQEQPSAGTMLVHTLDDKEYLLEAKSEGGVSATRSIGVVILKPPEITSFEATPSTIVQGQSATLSWQLKRAERAGINGGTVDPSRGTLVVTPTSDTVYKLVVENELGREQRQVTVKVLIPTPTP